MALAVNAAAVESLPPLSEIATTAPRATASWMRSSIAASVIVDDLDSGHLETAAVSHQDAKSAGDEVDVAHPDAGQAYGIGFDEADEVLGRADRLARGVDFSRSCRKRHWLADSLVWRGVVGIVVGAGE